MVDFFRSAISYLSGEGENTGGNSFVGQTVDLGDGLKLKIKKVIAEGGYGFVFVAQDTTTSIEYALKRQIVPSDGVKVLKQEISFLQQLSGHPHIINFVTAASNKDGQGGAEFLILTELITGGELVDIVNTRRLSPKQVLRVFYETCSAVAHMHSQTPPIIHRDIKVENLLISSEGAIKLCDFGSATTQRLSPDHSWSATQRGLAEDEIQRNTTPMYRAPEMIDLYSNNPINEKADIWALGCLLYKLCFQEHPFEDSAKLRILNANYHIPPDDTVYKTFHSLIRSCLVIDPNIRPSVDSIIAQLYSIADKYGERLDGPPKEPLLLLLKSKPHTQTETETPHHSESSSASAALQATSQQAQKFFGFMKGGAENLLKNIKDTSSKVMNTVQSTPRHKPLDISYITSRLIVMSFPYEVVGGATTHPNSLEDVAAYLEETHPSQYLVFNLSGEQYDVDCLNGQVVDYEWPHKALPSLESIVELCRQLDSWLRADPLNVLVIHCKDGIYPSGLLVAAYLLFIRALPSPNAALRLFSVRRLPDGQSMEINPSEKRYLNYLMDLVRPSSYKPHPHPFMLQTLKLTTVPIYNETKNGCKPFVEIFVDGERVHTSCTKENMDKLRMYMTEDKSIQIPLGVSVQGNVQVIVHHIKSVPLSKSAGMGMSAVKMFKFQFHTGYVSTQMTSLTLERNELDGSATRKQEKFPSPFKVVIDIKPVQYNSVDTSSNDIAWQNLPHPKATPLTCFSTVQEQEEVINLFGESTVSFRSTKQATPTSIGYGQLLEDDTAEPPTGNLIDNTPPAAGHSTLNEFIEYSSYRQKESASSHSSESSSSSSSSSDSEKPSASSSVPLSHVHHGTNTTELFGEFFSNPGVAAVGEGRTGNVEEANLLEFSIEDTVTEPPVQVTTSTISSTAGNFNPWLSTTSGNNSDPFGDWEWTRNTTPTTSSAPPPPVTNNSSLNANSVSFDPFGPSSSDVFNLMSNSTPLLPTAAASQTSSTSSFTSAPAHTTSNNTTSYYPRSSGHSGWASFTSTNTSSINDKPGFKAKDPFGDIWNQATSKSQDPINIGSTGVPQSQQSTKPTMTSRPTYQVYGGGTSRTVPQNSKSGLNVPSSNQRARSPSPVNRFGPVPPNLSKNQFNDLLDPKLFTKPKDEGQTTLKNLKKKNEIGKIIDPDRAKVAEWADGKEHNIRALLSSLHTILWEGETRWTPIGMHQLVEPEMVSKFFRRACLSVHPDKAQGTPHENLARAIFDELNDAYELFEQSGAKSLYQI